MSRPSFYELYMQFAEGLARRSTCKRLQVGCVITSSDSRYVLGVGYNGNYSGGPNDCDATTPGGCGDLHAEENAIINCRADRGTAKTVYVTHSPCVMCAKRVINLGGVKLVYFAEEFRDMRGVDILLLSGVGVHRMGLQCE